MAAPKEDQPLPEGIFSLLDTDLYKLTMQNAVLKYFPDVEVTYSFTNRTPHMQLNQEAFHWLQVQVDRLANIRLGTDELEYLRTTCPYLSRSYLRYLTKFQFTPSSQIKLELEPTEKGNYGALKVHIGGLWVECILYEVPMLALISEAYFRFCERDWTHDGQVSQAKSKGLRLMESGCVFSEFGSRRRRDYYTQELVIKGLVEAQKEAQEKQWKGKLAGTSNVHFAMRFGIPPVGTVAHEWFMGLAAITKDYKSANETALRYWLATFGKGVLGIALTDTFGTKSFLEAFRRPIIEITTSSPAAAVSSSHQHQQQSFNGSLTTSETPIETSDTTISGLTPLEKSTSAEKVPTAQMGKASETEGRETYAHIFTGTRQDSGDPLEFIKTMSSFYQREGITERKSIVFSDSLNVEKCIQYKQAAEEAGINPSFGVGTFFTNDFRKASSTKEHNEEQKSPPLNIVIKISSAAGNHAVKISDNMGKNTGDKQTIEEVKRVLGYQEKSWRAGDDESRRW